MTPATENYAEFLRIPPSHSESDAGRDVAEIVGAVRQDFGRAFSLAPVRSHRVDPLLETFSESSAAGWDGYEAKPVRTSTVKKAWQFLQALPSGIPEPEVSADPDGDVALDWIKSRDRMFSVSVRDNGDIHYAGVYGRGKVHGADTFDDEVPAVVLQGIVRVFA